MLRLHIVHQHDAGMFFLKLRKNTLDDFVRRKRPPVPGVDVDAPQHHTVFRKITAPRPGLSPNKELPRRRYPCSSAAWMFMQGIT